MSPQQFNDLADPLPEAMCLIARNGRIVAANTAMAKMLDIPRQALMGTHVDALLADTDVKAEKTMEYLQTCLRTRTFIPGTIQWLKHDDQALACRCEGAVVPPAPGSSELHVLLRCTPREAATNSKFALLNSELEKLRRAHHDVMDQKAKLESIVEERTSELRCKTRELEKTNKELDQFAYVASHDLKAPLRAIANLSQWIEEDINDFLTTDTRKQMELLRGRVHRMEALIEGILQYSRVGRVSVNATKVDVGELLAETIETLAPPKDFSFEIAPDMPGLDTSRVLLSQVFANLIGNAIKYRERDDGHVQVSVKDEGSFYHFSVTDDGPGIPETFHGKVFQLFQTLQARDTLESTGIGLTLVKKIVEEHGGTIKLESTEGQGGMALS